MIPVYKLGQMSDADRARILCRAQTDVLSARKKAQEIISNVRKRGDEALVACTRKWDDPDFTKDKLIITKKDIEQAYANVSGDTLKKIRGQIRLSKRFHLAQKKNILSWEEEISPGITAGEKWTPRPSAGLYIPGGKNPFPTVMQILAVPAKIAGCPRIAACISPKGRVDEVIVTANECGICELYRIGGAQAIAALAYGTESIPPVELIAGPGSPVVTAAKILCQERRVIDMPAGPSEAIILADRTLPSGISLRKKASWCAADILARAEHGPDSAGVLVTDSEELAFLVKNEILRQYKECLRKDYINSALATYSAIIITSTMEEAITFINNYAPEHLEILTETPRKILREITNAGSVFLGMTNPVAAGDYASGINHILPTGGWARRASPVGVWTFMKRVQYSEVSRKGLKTLRPIVETLSEIEGLDAHKKSVLIRFRSQADRANGGTNP